MDPELISWVTALASGGVVAGLFLLWRGMADFRASVRVGDTSTSTVASLAAGEVRLSGVVEVAEMTLVSLLQGVSCVYYQATIGQSDDGASDASGVSEERSIGFRLRDATGSIRVFPRGARVDAPVRFSGETGAMGDEPAGLDIRTGPATRLSEPDRETAIAELLEVRDPGSRDWSIGLRGAGRGRQYREARLEPGDAVTIVGRALPFSDLSDPVAADHGSEADAFDQDPEILADMAEAQAAGILETNPEEAWGNAAIPGFGIGRPVTMPEIDPAANRLPLATAEAAAAIERIFEIEPDTLVLASSAEVPLLIAHGTPGAVMERSRGRYTLGLLGAILAIASAMVVAIMINGGFAR